MKQGRIYARHKSRGSGRGSNAQKPWQMGQTDIRTDIRADGRTNTRTNTRTDKPSYRVASSQLTTKQIYLGPVKNRVFLLKSPGNGGWGRVSRQQYTILKKNSTLTPKWTERTCKWSNNTVWSVGLFVYRFVRPSVGLCVRRFFS